MSGKRVAEDSRDDEELAQLVVVCGLPGAGKTTVSEAIAERLDGQLYRTDVIRKELFHDPEYTQAEREAVYEELHRRAKATLEAGRSVVLDGTFKHRAHRGESRRAAQDLDVPLALVQVVCDEDVVRERIRARSGDASDADFEIHRQYQREFEAIAGPFARIDNSGALTDTLDQVADLF